MTDELPWAMLAKGPAWTSTGVFSRVCEIRGGEGPQGVDGVWAMLAKGPAWTKTGAFSRVCVKRWGEAVCE